LRFRCSAPATLIIATALVVSLATVFSSRLFSGMTDDVEASQFRMMRAIVEAALRDAENKALARAELIAALPTVQKLMAAGDRAGLLAELSPMFVGQKARHGAEQAQFHLAPATSFLRLHDPEKFGDDLTAFRPMVVAVNRDHNPLKGIAIARNGPAIFGATPISDSSGKPIGSFEIGMDVGPVLASLKTAYGLDLAFFVEEQSLLQFAKGADPEKLGDQNRVGRYIRFETTNSALMAELTGPQDLAVVSEPVTYVRDFNGVARGVVLVPINNAAGTALGVIAATMDFSGSRAAANRTLIWQAAIAAMVILLLSGLVVAVLRGLLLRPIEVLGQRYEDIAAGGALEAVAAAETFPQELQPFVALYERIRLHRKKAEPSA